LALHGHRTYVGFGFGAIQAGLFLHEAFQSGNFGRLVVADVVPEVVQEVRRAGGHFRLNVARADGVEQLDIGPVTILDLSVAADREQLVEALAAADEIGTAVPGVDYYVSPGEGSLHRLLADGLRRKATRGGPRAVVYVAENHNHAAEILESHTFGAMQESDRETVPPVVRFLNTVVGKMSGVVSDAEQIRSQQLSPVTPEATRALLVEEFNRILISRIAFDDSPPDPEFQPGITVFEQKDDLVPFSEAKLYGHNATHAVAAYVGTMLGVRHVSDLADVPGVLEFLRAAFIAESGAALIRKYRGVDPLFSREGYQRYADDLLQRMMNPFLRDTVERVGRHCERKLGWHDRLIGTIRLALAHDICPRRYAFGTAAALACLDRELVDKPSLARAVLERLWGDEASRDATRAKVLELVDDGLRRLGDWRQSGFPPLNEFMDAAGK
jgi:mannitol-1-phosphate 5-dehydrogenase